MTPLMGESGFELVVYDWLVGYGVVYQYVYWDAFV